MRLRTVGQLHHEAQWAAIGLDWWARIWEKWEKQISIQYLNNQACQWFYFIFIMAKESYGRFAGLMTAN